MRAMLALIFAGITVGCARYGGDDWPVLDTSVEPDVEGEAEGPVDTGVDTAVDTVDAWDALESWDAREDDAADAADAPDEVEMCGDAVCAGSESCCSSRCTDTRSDFENCGACGVECDAEKTDGCIGGSCTCDGSSPCPSSYWMMCCTPDGCVDVYWNNEHCGDCTTVCWVMETCSSGICIYY